MLLGMGIRNVSIQGDSQLVLRQLSEDYKWLSASLAPYCAVAMFLLQEFDDVLLHHVPRAENDKANSLAQVASKVQIPGDVGEKIFKVVKRELPSYMTRQTLEVHMNDVETDDWREPIIQYLKDPRAKTPRRIRLMALNYTLIDDVFFRKTLDKCLLRCLSKKESLKSMAEVHEGVCGSHQSGPKMKWLIRRHGHYRPTMMSDCIKCAKGCPACQRHGPVQHVPASE